MRAFVAVEVPAELPGLPARSVTAPLHLTLAFLAEVDAARQDELVAAVTAAVRPVPAFPLSLGGFGAFPDPGRPRIVYREIGDGAEALGVVAARVRAALDGGDFAYDRRPFTPHLTVLRVRGPHDRTRARALLATGADTPGATFPVTEVQVSSSVLTGAGAVHTVLGRCPLAPTAA